MIDKLNGFLIDLQKTTENLQEKYGGKLLLFVCCLPQFFLLVKSLARYMEFYFVILLAVFFFLRMVFESFVLSVVLGKLPRLLAALFGGAAALLFAADSVMLYEFSSVTDKAAINLLLDTNPVEVKEFLLLNAPKILAAAAGMGAVFALLLAFLRRVSLGKMPFAALLSGGIIYVVMFTMPVLGGFCSPPLRFSADLISSVREIAEYKSIYESIEADKTDIIKNEGDIPFVVFVVGESTGRHHMGVYGCRLPNTPYAQERVAEGSMAVFSDVISPQTETMLVFERLFTFYNNESPGKWYDYPNLIDILNNAGYNTEWISNQETSGLYGNVARAYANRCAEKNFTALRSSGKVAYEDYIIEYDEKILPILDEAIERAAAKNFFVIHLMGTHFIYKARYPKEFDRFTAADEEKYTDGDTRQIAAEYDNSVLYNDYVLEEIIRRFEDKNALVVYLSDHGEEIVGFRVGHYHDGTLRQTEIPFMVWGSPAFRAACPDIWARIVKAKDRPYMTDDMIHSFLDIMGIAVKEYDGTRSIFSADYNSSRPRIYNGKTYRKDHNDRLEE